MLKQSFFIALGLAAALTVSQAQAGTVDISTGVASYTVNGSPAVTIAPPGFPFPTWYTPPGPAEWIAPSRVTEPNGAYDYTTTVTLATSPAYAISGTIIADDEVTGITIVNSSGTHSVSFTVLDSDLPHGLNGPPVALPSSAVAAIDSYLVSGSNMITVDTMNVFGSVTGLYFNASITAVPEPASMALLGIGLTGLLTFRRFRKRQANV